MCFAVVIAVTKERHVFRPWFCRAACEPGKKQAPLGGALEPGDALPQAIGDRGIERGGAGRVRGAGRGGCICDCSPISEKKGQVNNCQTKRRKGVISYASWFVFVGLHGNCGTGCQPVRFV